MPEKRDDNFTVEQVLVRERLDTFLHARYPMVSRATLQRLILEGEVRVNGQIVKPAYVPRSGQQISVHWPAPKSSTLAAECIPLDVLFEDADLLVINKPAGLVVHPAAGHDEHTLVNALLHHCAGGLSGIGGVARPGIVHRLDKETSGCLLVAKTDHAHLGLTEQFAARCVRKTYHAVVCGELQRDYGEIHAAIARHPNHRKKMAVREEGGRDAWSSYRVLERLRCSSLVEVRLHTGRTHQIRVHFQFLGYPLLGDETYAKRQNQRIREQTGVVAARQMLHAQSITFVHPVTKAELSFQAPWPQDFRDAVEALRVTPQGL